MQKVKKKTDREVASKLKPTTSFYRGLIVLIVIMSPYLYLYISKYHTFYTWVNDVAVPLGDDYPIHVYFILKSCRDPLHILQSQYPSLIHIALGYATGCDFWTATWAMTTMSAALIPAGVAAWGLLLKKIGGIPGVITATITVLAMPRLLQSVGDGQIPEKFVLLVVIPAVLYLYLSGRHLIAGVAAGVAAWISFLGAAYIAVLVVSTISPLLVIAAAATALPRLPSAYQTAGAALTSEPQLYYYPLQASIYAYFNPAALPLLFLIGTYLASKRPKTVPLFYTAAVLWAAAYIFPQINERLIRSASFVLAMATVTMSLELKNSKALLVTLTIVTLGPAAVGWTWAVSHIAEIPYGEELKKHELFMPAVRTAPCKFEVYKNLVETMPPNASIWVAWQLDLWLLPYMYYYRPDVNVNVVVCPQDLKPPYVISGIDPRSWYLPCYYTVPPGICDIRYESAPSH